MKNVSFPIKNIYSKSVPAWSSHRQTEPLGASSLQTYQTCQVFTLMGISHFFLHFLRQALFSIHLIKLIRNFSKTFSFLQGWRREFGWGSCPPASTSSPGFASYFTFPQKLFYRPLSLSTRHASKYVLSIHSLTKFPQVFNYSAIGNDCYCRPPAICHSTGAFYVAPCKFGAPLVIFLHPVIIMAMVELCNTIVSKFT